jgi:O-glycosyl hydrolase
VELDFGTLSFSYYYYFLILLNIFKILIIIQNHSQIPYMKLAQNVSQSNIKLFGSPWSPPVWMKDNSNIKGGSIKGRVGGEYYQIWANYLVRY